MDATSHAMDKLWSAGHEFDLGWYRAPTEDAETRTLVVFVHGLLGDYRSTWKGLLPCVFERLPASVGVLSFSYPATALRSADMWRATEELVSCLTAGDFASYSELCFIVHSAGGLVTKRALLHPTHGAALTRRTRRIINFGVPHEGSGTFGWCAYLSTLPVFVTYGLAVGFTTQLASFLDLVGRRPLGFNWIPTQLTVGTEKLRALESAYIERVRAADGRALPRPTSLDIVGRHDTTIRPKKRELEFHSDVRHAKVRNSHRMKPPKSCRDQAVALVSDELAKFFDDLEVPALRAVIDGPPPFHESFALIEGLVPAGALGSDARRQADGTWIGSQRQVATHLLERLESDSFPSSVLVTGAAGVGKSTVLRHLASALAARALRGGSALRPIHVPLSRLGEAQAGSSPAARPPLTWRVVREWWAESIRASVMTRVSAPSLDRVAQRSANALLASPRRIIILDGVDDFLAHRPDLSIASVLHVVREIQAEPNGLGTSVVLGMRSSISMPSYGVVGETLEVARLSREEALAFVRDRNPSQELVSRLQQESQETLQRLLFTPLILERLLGRHLEPGTLSTAAGVFEETLRAIVEHSKLDVVLGDVGVDATTDDIIDMLTIVGQAAFSAYWSYWTANQMATQVRMLADAWEKHNATRAAPDPEAVRLGRAARSLCQEHVLRIVLTRTVFTVSELSAGFEHREWEEYLAARHLACAARFENIGEMSRRGSWTRMHFLVGEMLDKDPTAEFSEGFVTGIIEGAREKGISVRENFIAQMPVGNLLGVIGHCRRTLRAPAMNRLLRAYTACGADVPVIVELVALQTLGFRMLCGAPGDEALAQTFLERLRSAYGPAAPASRNTLLQLAASLWARVLAKEGSGTDRNPVEPPLDAALARASLDFLSYIDAQGVRRTNALDDAMQRVFLNVQAESFDHPQKTVSSAVYMFTLVAVARAGLALSDVQAALTLLLGQTDSATKLRRVIASTPWSETINRLWQHCRSEFFNR